MSESIDIIYKGLLIELIGQGIDKPDRTGTGCRSLHGLSFDYDMANGFPLLSLKKTGFKNILKELLWFVSGNTNIYPLVSNGVNIWTDDCYREFLKVQRMQNVPEENIPNKECFVDLIKDIPSFREEFGDLGPVYGAQWVRALSPSMTVDSFSFKNMLSYDYSIDLNLNTAYSSKLNGEHLVVTNIKEGTAHTWITYYKIVNQLQVVLDSLRDNPYSRRHLVDAWSPGEISAMTLPPCHYSFQFFVRPNPDSYKPYLDLLWNQRSVDVGLGLPYNIASYATLLMMYCTLLEMEPGKLMFRGGDVHIYRNHIEPIREVIHRSTFEANSPKLNIYPFSNTDKHSYKKVLEEFRFDDFKVEGYVPHPFIKLELST